MYIQNNKLHMLLTFTALCLLTMLPHSLFATTYNTRTL